jgi:HPt (histidine-containing phosphotransfer) domain-containing protein
MEHQPGIDVAAVLNRLGGNRALLARLLAEFARSQAGTADAIRAALDRGAVGDAARHAHTLKGVAANLSAERLAREAGAIELALRNAATAHLEPLLARLDAAMAEVMSGLTARDGSASAAAPVAGAGMPAAELARMVAAFDALLCRNSLAARRELGALQAALARRSIDAGALVAAVERLAFVEARRALRTLASGLDIELPPA